MRLIPVFPSPFSIVCRSLCENCAPLLRGTSRVLMKPIDASAAAITRGRPAAGPSAVEGTHASTGPASKVPAKRSLEEQAEAWRRRAAQSRRLTYRTGNIWGGGQAFLAFSLGNSTSGGGGDFTAGGSVNGTVGGKGDDDAVDGETDAAGNDDAVDGEADATGKDNAVNDEAYGAGEDDAVDDEAYGSGNDDAVADASDAARNDNAVADASEAAGDVNAAANASDRAGNDGVVADASDAAVNDSAVAEAAWQQWVNEEAIGGAAAEAGRRGSRAASDSSPAATGEAANPKAPDAADDVVTGANTGGRDWRGAARRNTDRGVQGRDGRVQAADRATPAATVSNDGESATVAAAPSPSGLPLVDAQQVADFRRFTPTEVGEAVAAFVGQGLPESDKAELRDALRRAAVMEYLYGCVAASEPVADVTRVLLYFVRRAHHGKFPFGVERMVALFLRRHR